MKKYLFVLLTTIISLNTAYSQKTVLLETKYYSFQSNAALNAHMYLYNRAMGCKFKKVQQDSLAYYSFKDKLKMLNATDLIALNGVMRFYMDSLTTKDLVFFSLMRNFSDHLTKGTDAKRAWQSNALEQLKVFQPYFNKLYFKEIDAQNKAWIAANKTQIMKQELTVIPELERIYQTKLPAEKIIVDLSSYATWAGAYSYKDEFCHVILSSTHGANKGDLSTEVVFHESSHFLVDKLLEKITEFTKGKEIKPTINLWHNMIFYTTGLVLERHYAKEGKLFFPYYVQMKFEDKFPDFKATVEACKLYWDPYINGQLTFEDALNKITNNVSEKK